ncbi:MAG: MFS transporter [Dehalococcoidia bacterium]|nr:MFS transporter [Dehalococcoidia bacterium]
MKLLRPLFQMLHYSLVEPAREEPRVLLLALSTMLMTMGMGIVVPILPLLVKSYGLAAVMVGFAVSAFALARVFTNVPAGVLTRLCGARFVLVLGALLSVVGNFMVGLIPSYMALVAFRFVAGAGSALFITASVIFVAEVSTPQNRGRLMTIYQAAFLLGISLGPALGGITADLFGFAAPFYIVALVSAASGVWALAKIPANVARAPERTANPVNPQQYSAPAAAAPASSVFRNVGYHGVNLLTFGTFFTRGGTLFTLWPLLGKERYGLGPGQLGLVFTISSAVNMVCQPFVGALVDRVGRKTLLVPTMFLFSIALLVSGLIPVMAAFVVAQVIYGVAQAVEAPAANSYVADVAPSQQRAMALGVNRTFGDVGLVVGSPLLGLIADLAGIPWGLVVNGGLLLVPGILFALMAKETAGPRAAAAAQGGRGS